jgi:predicted secreted protein
MRRASVVASAALLLIGCGEGATASAKTFKNPKGTISVNSGDRFAIELSSTPGTGYSWQLTRRPDPKIVRYLGSRTVSGSNVPGGPAQQLLSFIAKAPGTTSMTLSYVGPGRDHPVGKRLPLTVKVK